MKSLAVIYFLLINLAYSYINVNPINFDKKIDGVGEGQEYVLYNGTNSPIRYNIYLDRGSREKNMEEWIEYYPKNITLKPGEEGVVKVYIKSPKGAVDGEYGAVLGFREIAVPTLESSRSGESSVKLLTNLRMEIVGFVGNIAPELEFLEAKIEKTENSLEFQGVIINRGTRRGKYELYLTDGRNREKYFLGDMTILLGEKIELKEFNQEIKDSEFLRKLKNYDRVIIMDKELNSVVRMVLIR